MQLIAGSVVRWCDCPGQNLWVMQGKDGEPEVVIGDPSGAPQTDPVKVVKRLAKQQIAAIKDYVAAIIALVRKQRPSQTDQKKVDAAAKRVNSLSKAVMAALEAAKSSVQNSASAAQRIPNYPNVARPGWLKRWTRPPSYNGPVKHGRWVNPDGTPGVPDNSLWISTRKSVINVVGRGQVIDGVQYSNPIVYYRGVVDFSPWAVGKPLSVPGLVGTSVDSNADMRLIMQAIAQREDLSGQTAARQWLTLRELSPHHAGGDKVILLPRGLHAPQFGGVQHTDVSNLSP